MYNRAAYIYTTKQVTVKGFARETRSGFVVMGIETSIFSTELSFATLRSDGHEQKVLHTLFCFQKRRAREIPGKGNPECVVQEFRQE